MYKNLLIIVFTNVVNIKNIKTETSNTSYPNAHFALRFPESFSISV